MELALMQEMTDFVFSAFGVCSVYTEVFEWNPASIRMLEKGGYAFEGRLRKSVTKNGQTIESMLYAIVRE